MKAVTVRKFQDAIDLPVVLVAAVLATVIVLYSVTWLEADRCLDAGGRVAKYGLDHACETGNGGTVPFVLTDRERVVFVGAWVGLFAVVWWAMTRIVGVRRSG